MAKSNSSPLRQRLKDARKAAGYSQKKLGILAGIDEFTSSARMNQYETGRYVPDYNILANIANVLGIPPAYFYCDDDRLAELILLYGKLADDKQRLLLTIASSINIETS